MPQRAFFDQLMAGLEEARLVHPYLAATINLELALLQAGSRLLVTVDIPAIAPEIAQSRLEEGQPLLRREDLTLDCEQIKSFQESICVILAEHRPELADRLALFRQTTISPCNGLSHPPPDEDVELVAYVQRQTLRPFLAAYARSMLPVFQAIGYAGWRCPVCGGQSDMAALSRPDGQRILLCNACDHEWPCQRIGCPFCGTEDSAAWAYYPSDDRVYRLYVCENCRHYLKTVDHRQQARAFPLAVERVLTGNMDAAAREAGYRP